MTNSLYIVALVFFIALAGLFSGAETGLYQLSRIRLRLGIERKRLLFIILGKCLDDSPGLLLSMLVGTNLAHYLVTGIVTLLLLSTVKAEHTAELFATLLTTPVLFVFSELIPKNIFFYRADRLMPCAAPILFAFGKLLKWCGTLPLLKFISELSARITGMNKSPKEVMTSVQRHHVETILAETHEEDILSSVQTDIINRIAGIPSISISSVMIPMSGVQTADVNSDNKSLLKILEKSAFTRLPVTDGLPANIVGFVNIYKALSSNEPFGDLQNFLKPIRKLQANTPIIEAINIMQSENHKIVLITTKIGRTNREKPIGIVTMKDLVEEFLGELVEW